MHNNNAGKLDKMAMVGPGQRGVIVHVSTPGSTERTARQLESYWLRFEYDIVLRTGEEAHPRPSTSEMLKGMQPTSVTGAKKT